MKAELLAPAGNLKKLKVAIRYGADAVYLGGKAFSLRAFSDNFTEEELEEGIAYAHARGKKVYVCANIFAKNEDFKGLPDYFRMFEKLHADGVLVSDLGVFRILRECAPALNVHISTQANTLNKEAARFWKEAGAVRVVLARELSVQEIKEIHDAVPDLELEAFVHGATCISYSGRCLLSDYLTSRPSNRGECVQACRFQYEMRAKEPESDWFPITEDGRGAYLLSGKDLNLSAHLSELAEAGVSSFKIEGRMKGEYYLATVVNAYRRLLDGADVSLMQSELLTASHRDYTQFNAFGKNNETVSYNDNKTDGTCDFIAVVKDYRNNRAYAEMRGRFYEGDTLEVLSPTDAFLKVITVKDLRDGAFAVQRDAKRVQDIYSFECAAELHEGDILRRRKKNLSETHGK